MTTMERVKIRPMILKEPEVEVVDWMSWNRDERGVCLMSTEYIDKDRYMELYADGTVYIKDRKNEIVSQKKVDFSELKKAADNYHRNRKFIRISELLNKDKNEL